MNEVTVVGKGKELEFFTEGGLEPFLAEVKTMVKDFKHDMTTQKGRDATRKFARKISTFKVKVDDSGKELVAEWKKNSKAVDESRKKSRDALDTLRDEARKPLTDWEQIDKDRIAAHEVALEALRDMVNVEVETAAAYASRLVDVKAVTMGKCWEEFSTDAIEAKEEAIATLEAGIVALTKSEADAAELDRLRKETAAREQADRDAKIVQDTLDVAARESEEREKRLIIEREDAKAETERVKLQQAADIEQAKKDEAARIQREADEAKEKQERLEANKRHRGKVQKEVRASMLALEMDERLIDWLITKIDCNEISNVTINY